MSIRNDNRLLKWLELEHFGIRLGGSTRTVMIANIGPAVSSVSETLNTLTYAGSVRKIQNRPVISTEFIKVGCCYDRFRRRAHCLLVFPRMF